MKPYRPDFRRKSQKYSNKALKISRPIKVSKEGLSSERIGAWEDRRPIYRKA